LTRIAAALVLAFGPCTTIPRTPPPAAAERPSAAATQAQALSAGGGHIWWAVGKVTPPATAAGAGTKSAKLHPVTSFRAGTSPLLPSTSRSYRRPPLAEETRWRSTSTKHGGRPGGSTPSHGTVKSAPQQSRTPTRPMSDLQRARSLPEPWRSIVRCESLNDRSWPVTSTSTARGWFQFLRSTWRSLGLHGDPAAAPFDVQYAAARRLARRDGLRAWDCARMLGWA
jgi:hypothetical protein